MWKEVGGLRGNCRKHFFSLQKAQQTVMGHLSPWIFPDVMLGTGWLCCSILPALRTAVRRWGEPRFLMIFLSVRVHVPWSLTYLCSFFMWYNTFTYCWSQFDSGFLFVCLFINKSILTDREKLVSFDPIARPGFQYHMWQPWSLLPFIFTFCCYRKITKVK